MASEKADESIVAAINYFSRDAKFEYEKPYVTSFPVDGIEGACVTNHMFDVKQMEIYDVRAGFTPQLDVHGFVYLTAPTAMKPADFDSDAIVRGRYFSELKSILHSAFPEYITLAFFDYEVDFLSGLYMNLLTL
jgi:hypothetical protein